MHAVARQAGFTLVELVLTMVISTVVVAFVSMFISVPVQGFMDQTRRVRLVDSAGSALQRMSRDVRRALPNSVRTRSAPDLVALEILSTVDGARYRGEPPGTAAAVLDFAAADGSFNVLGPFTQVAKPFNETTHYLAIYNVGVPGADAYEPASTVITPADTLIGIAADGATGEDRVTVAPPFKFAYESPTQRVFLVEGPVTYLCNLAAGTLTRYEGYTIAPDQADVDSAAELIGAGARDSLMADQVVGCTFTYAPGTAERGGLLALQIAVGSQGESVSLLAQVHVDNVP
jgi:MSHA biogenesis protein MshO